MTAVSGTWESREQRAESSDPEGEESVMLSLLENTYCMLTGD